MVVWVPFLYGPILPQRSHFIADCGVMMGHWANLNPVPILLKILQDEIPITAKWDKKQPKITNLALNTRASKSWDKINMSAQLTWTGTSSNSELREPSLKRVSIL